MLSVMKAAIIILMVAFGLWIYENEFDRELFIPYVDAVLGIIGGLLLAFAILGAITGKIVGTTERWQRKTRCIRCGIKIAKNEMYCPAHKKEVAEEFLRGKNPDAHFE